MVSFNWAFQALHQHMDHLGIQALWNPGHQGIPGNELADWLANQASTPPTPPPGPDTPEASHTTSGLRTLCQQGSCHTQLCWWTQVSPKLSAWYQQWLDSTDDVYKVKEPPELCLQRPVLHWWLALRSSHSDFCWYHERFQHEDARLTCTAVKAPVQNTWSFADTHNTTSGSG